MFMPDYTPTADDERTIDVRVANFTLEGALAVPRGATGLVLFVHGSGSSRFSPRNRAVANELNLAGFATLLLDLLTPTEERWDATSAALRFDIDLLAQRLIMATDWLASRSDTSDLGIGYFGASTGAAAALAAAAHRQESVRAIVSRGGRPDLAGPILSEVRAPTLLIVGGRDTPVIAFNRAAHHDLSCVKELRIVPGATHLFEEPGALEEVTRLARGWYRHHLRPALPPGVAG